MKYMVLSTPIMLILHNFLFRIKKTDPDPREEDADPNFLYKVDAPDLRTSSVSYTDPHVSASN
jgi:hypothetical protein